jgi:prolipoprotein diacylglyceryltransferase
VPPAVIAFAFDPLLEVGGSVVRWETLGMAGAGIAAIVVAALIAGRLGLRRDDLVFVVLGVIPGAVICGRLGYVLIHLDYYGDRAAEIVEPSRGGFELALAVVGAIVTGTLVALMLDGSIGRWLHAAALPALLVLGFGKLALVLGGTGQGTPSDLAWATAYLGPGPWGSLAPALPSQPSQVYEALATLAIAIVIVALLAAGRFVSRDGRVLFVAIGLWAAARALVAGTWRDPAVLGPLNADQLIDLAVVVGCAAILVAYARRDRREAPRPIEAAAGVAE